MSLIDDSVKTTTLASVSRKVSRNYADTKWTELNKSRLKDLITQKLSARQIAAALSKQANETFSRNSIIGKARRLGLPLLGERPANIIRIKSSTPKSKPKSKPVTIVKIKSPPLTAPTPPTLSEVVANPKNLTILEIQRGECYWPTGRESETVFCGHPTVAKSSWCAAHSRLGYVTPNMRWS